MKTPHPAIANIRAQLEIMDTNEHYSKWRMHRALTALDALEKEMQVMGDAYGVGSKDVRTTPDVCAPSPANPFPASITYTDHNGDQPVLELKRQAEPVSLRECAKVVQMAARDGNDSPQDYGDAERIAKAVLDAAGVTYHVD